jgi:hypothetical protein
MISVILYGRNDNYGYNLHKRAALSFNCIAEVLCRDSEILFVDYNTPNDFPTFPEAIQDTLTEKAVQMLRIFRVRPHIHQRFRAKTRLAALEPISRNVAIRRSNPANRWILSTNTDMIFVPQRTASIDEISRDLPEGFYHAPRIELPETLWESLDRSNSREAIETVRDWGSSLHINEIVKVAPSILYDGPGDFQLIQRADLFRIDGFHEGMLLGWHVDANMAMRLSMIHGDVGDLGQQILGYHCDHTRQVTPAHSAFRTENDPRIFVDNIERPDLPEQVEIWGCALDDIEEIRLTEGRSSAYVSALKEQIGPGLTTLPAVNYTAQSYNKTDYDPRHLLPFLADLFICAQKDTKVAWFGVRRQTIDLFSGLWRRLGFKGKILVASPLVHDYAFSFSSETTELDFPTLMADADVFVFDFGTPMVEDRSDAPREFPAPLARAFGDALLKTIYAEHQRLERGASLRQIVAINAINNVFEGWVIRHIGAGLTPYGTRMRHGYVLPLETRMNWTSRLQAGEAGILDGPILRAREGRTGTVVYGPFQSIMPGRYRLVLKVSGHVLEDLLPDSPVAVLEVASRRHYISHCLVTGDDIARGIIEIEVEITEELALELDFAIETRLRTLEPLRIVIVELICERLLDATPAAFERPQVLSVGNWLPLLFLGAIGGRRNGLTINRAGTPGHLLYGPYWTLPPGEYEAKFQVTKVAAVPIGNNSDVVCSFAAVSGGEYLGLTALRRADLQEKDSAGLRFTVTPERALDPTFGLELQVWDNAIVPFGIEAVTVQRLGEPDVDSGLDWLKVMDIGPAGSWHENAIQIRIDRRGLVAYGPNLLLRPGRYEIVLEFGYIASESELVDVPLLTLAILTRRRLRTSRVLRSAELITERPLVAFEIENEPTPAGRLPVELNIISSGGVAADIRAITVRRVGESTISVWPDPPRMNWTPWLQVGEAGLVDGPLLRAREERTGPVIHGPYQSLTSGRYRLILKVFGQAVQGLPTDSPVAVLEVASRHNYIAHCLISGDDVARGSIEIEVNISQELAAELDFALETRLRTLEPVRIAIIELICERLSETVPTTLKQPPALDVGNWLPLLYMGAIGGRRNGVTVNRTGKPGHLLYGPYWALPAGEYEANFQLAKEPAVARCSASDAVCSFEAVSGDDYLGLTALCREDHQKQDCVNLRFEVTPERAQDPTFALELRIWDSAIVPFGIQAVTVQRLGDPNVGSAVDELGNQSERPSSRGSEQ